MGIDSMRVGGGRCPPLLVGGLLIACLMLICNWWTSSSENLELLRQIDDFSEQLKISAEERDQCVTLRGKLEQRYKDSENEVASLHDQLEQQPKFKKRNEILEEANKMCKTELDSLNKLDAVRTATLDTLKSEKSSINSQLDEEKEENRKLSEKLMEVQDELHRLKSAQNSPADQESKLVETGTSNIASPIIPTEQGADNGHGNDDDNHIEESNIEEELENPEDDTNLGKFNNEVAKEKSEKLNRTEK